MKRRPNASKKNRRNRRKRVAKLLEKVHLNAAGIDIGSASHWVAVPEDRDDEAVREFKSFTPDLHALADWLDVCGIETIAMESTGVYWIPLFEILQERGFEVLLVNARHVKGVPGRKSDVTDCQWLQQLHTFGLLRGRFRPDAEITAIRTLVRHRGTLVQEAAAHIQRMQKTMTLMNLQLHNVISDVTGVTGMAIRLDTELKSAVARGSEAARLKDGKRAADAERHRTAAELGLPVDDEGHVLYPDAQIEYTDSEGRTGRVNIEVASGNYREGAIKVKAAAGFALHANGPAAARLLRTLGLGGGGDRSSLRGPADRDPAAVEL